ncbi:Protein-disulfide reductase, partial [Brachyspira hampsonii 30599]
MNINQLKFLKYIIILIFITAYTSLAQNNNLMNLNAFDSLNKNAEIS